MIEKRLTNEQQIIAMQKYFPQLTLRKLKKSTLIWKGKIKPNINQQVQLCTLTYFIKVRYKPTTVPSVRIIRPALDKGTPHLYRDGTLCLYYPNDDSWMPDKLIAKTIVPWTIEWLLCYELWKITNIWYGREAPH